MNTIIRHIGGMLLIALLSVAFIQLSVAAEPATASPLSEPAVLSAPEWEPWDGKTVGVQFFALPSALGFGFATSLSVSFGELVFLGFDEVSDERRERSYWISAWSGAICYTLVQGAFIGIVGDDMGGNGGVLAPLGAGLVNLAIWGSALHLSGVDSDYHPLMFGGFMVTTLLSQLAAYHLTAASQDDELDIMRERTGLSTLSLGLAPTDGGVSAGLGFQF